MAVKSNVSCSRLGNLLFRQLFFCKYDFSIKRGNGLGRTVSFQLLSLSLNSYKPLLTITFAFALLPIAAALGFVQGGPVAGDEGLVRASISASTIYQAHYLHAVDHACSRSEHRRCLLQQKYQHMQITLSNNSRNPNIFQANFERRNTAIIDGLLSGLLPCPLATSLDMRQTNKR